MKSTCSTLQPRSQRERGVILILVVFLIGPVLMILAYTFALSEWSAHQAALQIAADLAAHDAASTLCSRRECWNHSLINALESIRSLAPRGMTSRAAFSAAVGEAIIGLNDNLSLPATLYLTGPDGENEWTFDGITVRIQRGRWWPQARAYDSNTRQWINRMPNSVSTESLYPEESIFGYSTRVFVDPKFEPFDRFDGTTWQTEAINKGTPNFIAANAVRVEIEQPSYLSFASSMLFGPRPRAAFRTEAIASRARERPRLDFCAAPFGIPVCSLIDNTGEYNPERACAFDRYFTGPSRYCTAAQLQNNTCDVLPGWWYFPSTPGNSCDPSDPSFRTQRCACATATACDPEDPGCRPAWARGKKDTISFRDRFGQTCGQVLGQDSMECQFYPWPKQEQIADHYGVIGTAPGQHTTWYEPQQDPLYRWIFSTNCVLGGGESQLGTVGMALGDPFIIKQSPLQEQATDFSLWRIVHRWSNPYGDQATFEKFNPMMYDPQNRQFGPKGFIELGYPWLIGRVNDRTGFPYGLGKKLLDQVIQQGYLQPYDAYGKVICGIDVDGCNIDPTPCRPDPASCRVDPDTCTIDQNSGQVLHATCRIDPDACPIDAATCSIQPMNCKIDRATCRVDPQSCTDNAEDCKILPETCRVDPDTCTVPPTECGKDSGTGAVDPATCVIPPQRCPIDASTCRDKQQVEPWACNKAGIKQWGVCNSHRTMYDNRCQRRYRWYTPMPDQQACNAYAPFDNRRGGNNYNYTPIGECHPHHQGANVTASLYADGYVQEASGGWGNTWSHLLDGSDAEIADSSRWNCDETPPYQACPLSTGSGAHASLGVNYDVDYDLRRDKADWEVDHLFYGTEDYHPADLRVLHVRMPVIADVSPNARPCTGIAGSTDPDPIIDPASGTQEWRIIGFIRGYIYDLDIGMPPADPPAPSPADNKNPIWAWSFDKLTQTIVNGPNGRPARWEPAACNYDNADHRPWGFNPTYEPPPPTDPSGPPADAGAETSCNVVRGRVACEPGVIAGDYQGAFVEPEIAPALVYTR